MKKPIQLSLIFTKRDLNALMVRASTWFNRFYLLITLFEKKYLVISPVHHVFTNLREYPLVPLLFSSTVKSSCRETLLNPLYILNTSIRFCLLHLSSRVQSPKHRNLSSYLFFLHIHYHFSVPVLNLFQQFLVLTVMRVPCTRTILHMQSNQCLIETKHNLRFFIRYRSPYRTHDPISLSISIHTLL